MMFFSLCILLITVKDVVSTSSSAIQIESLPSGVTFSAMNTGSSEVEVVLESAPPFTSTTRVTSPQTEVAVNKSMVIPVGLESLHSAESSNATPIIKSPLLNKDAKNNNTTATPTIRLSSTELQRRQNSSLTPETFNTTSTSSPASATSKLDTTSTAQRPTTTITEKVSESSPSAAKRCCKPNYFLTNGECEHSPMPVKFYPYPNVTWKTKMLKCKDGYNRKEIDLDGRFSPKLDETTSSVLEWKVSIYSRRTSEYCIGQQRTGYSAFICEADLKTCSNATCLRKCCGLGEALSFDKIDTCKPSDEVLNLTFSTRSGDEIPPPKDLLLLPVVPYCDNLTYSFYKTKNHNLLVTGKLHLKKSGTILENTQFCVDHFKELPDTYVVAYCVTPPSAVQEWKVYLLPIGMVISIVFLSVIVLFHLFSRHLRNVQGLCFLAYSTSLLMSYIGFFISRMYAKQMSQTHCIFNGLFNQFCLLSAFFWLSVMCFDIWRVIRATMKSRLLTGILEGDSQKFCLYFAYAFGCPLIISLVTLIMQTLPVEYTEDMIVPGFWEESCWFPSDMSQFLYFYLFIATTNTISLLMLGHVMFMLCVAEKDKKRSALRASNSKNLPLFRQRLSLFIVMAACWFTEVISLHIPPLDMWVVTDILNSLQGVMIFIIFIASKKRWQHARSVLVGGVSIITSVFTSESLSSTKTTSSSERSDEIDVISNNGQQPPINKEDVQNERLGKEGIVNKSFQQETAELIEMQKYDFDSS